MWNDHKDHAGIQMIIPRNSEDLIEARLKILRVYEREKASGKGTFPCIEFERPDTTHFEVPVWTREARPLIEAWGKPPETDWVGKMCSLEVKDGNLILAALHEKPIAEQVVPQ